jgi:hypothetical protein
MITVSETLTSFEPYSDVLGYSPEDSLFFDIETTGFSPASSHLFLIGMIFFNGKEWQLEQLLAQSREEEQLLLETFLAKAKTVTTLIHFNGSTFDLPYLIHKAETYGMEQSLSSMQSVDLYQRFRPLKRVLSLERMNQQSLEAFLDWPRQDRLTGKHMVTLFDKFAASGEPGLQELLLLHNHDDLVGMTQLLSLSSYLMLFDGKFSAMQQMYPVNTAPGSAETAFAEFVLTLSAPIPAAFTVDTPYLLSAKGTTAVLHIPLAIGTFYHFFKNYKDYYYLPLEDQAIHKSVAAYMDPAYRQKAKPSNCYIKKSGAFLPQPQEIFTPAFSSSYEDHMCYFSYSEDILEHRETLNTYLSCILQTFL